MRTVAFHTLGCKVNQYDTQAMLERFQGMGWRKPYMIFALTDETYSLICTTKAPDGVDEKWFLFFIAFLNHLYWIAGCTIGALAGSFIAFNTKGIDFVMTALFVVILVDQWKATKNHLSAVIGLAGTLVCLALFGPDQFVLASMVLIVTLLTVFRKRLEATQEAAVCL